MHVSVETLEGLKHKLTVTVPSQQVEEEVSSRLKRLARKVKIDGFRPGKVPMHVVISRYEDQVLEEVAKELVQSTLFEALQEKELSPAGFPYVEPEQLEKSKDFKYTAVFEVFPTIEIKELDQELVELITAEVNDKDVKNMLEKLREQNKTWHEISRPVKKDDKVLMDFEGSIDGTLFEGGSAKDYELVVGSGSMIPGFEEGLIKGVVEKPFDIKVRFPDDYGAQDLAGKEAVFKIVLKKVMEGQLPELNDDFAKQFNVKEGGLEALTEEIKENMIRELEKRVTKMNKDRLFEKLRALNQIQLPEALIDKEIDNLKHEMYHRIFGHEHKENEQIPDFPRQLFEEEARRRVHLGLIFSEYVKKHQLTANPEQVNALIDKFAAAYESPESIRAWYQGSKERLAEVEALVLEDLVADKIAADAKIKHKKMDYDSVMDPKQGSEKKGD